MVNLVYSPRWFYGVDIAIDIVSVVVLLCIAYFAFQCYQLNKGKKGHLFLSLSYFLLALSFLFKILTNFTVYYVVKEAKLVGDLVLIFSQTHSSNALFFIGVILHRLFMLFGFYLLYSLYYKKQQKSTILFMIYFIIISTLFTPLQYYLFHSTAFLFLAFLIAKYYQNCCLAQDLPSKVLVVSFGTIALSQILYIFIEWNQLWYVLGEIIQLVGYGLLLVTFLLVLHYGKKKR